MTKIRPVYENKISNARIDQTTSEFPDKTEDTNNIGHADTRLTSLRSASHLSDNPLPLALLSQAQFCLDSRLIFDRLCLAFFSSTGKHLCHNNVVVLQFFFVYVEATVKKTSTFNFTSMRDCKITTTTHQQCVYITKMLEYHVSID